MQAVTMTDMMFSLAPDFLNIISVGHMRRKQNTIQRNKRPLLPKLARNQPMVISIDLRITY